MEREAASAAEETRPLVLVVDDDEDVSELLADELIKAGFTVHCAEDGRRARQMVIDHRPAVIVTDIMMPKRNGFLMMDDLARLAPDIPIIVYTGAYDQSQLEEMSAKLRAFRVLAKPAAPADLVAAVRAAVVAETD